jgi:hypothetical protein
MQVTGRGVTAKTGDDLVGFDAAVGAANDAGVAENLKKKFKKKEG